MASGSQPPYLRISGIRAGDRLVLSVAGELDLATVDMFTTQVREKLADGPVLLDLRELTFMDSSGVWALDAIARDAESKGWSFAVSPELQDNVKQLLEITGILAVLPMEDQ